MNWKIEYTETFSEWWSALSEDEAISVDASIRLLEAFGPQLKFPYSSGIEGSKFPHLRELRIQHKGQPYEYFMRLILEEWRFYWSVAISKAVIIGTKSLFLLPKKYTDNILNY